MEVCFKGSLKNLYNNFAAAGSPFFVFVVSEFAFGCSNTPKFTDISKYNLKPDSLSDGEQVKVIAGVI